MKVKLFLIFILFVFLREAIAFAYKLPVPEGTIKQNEQEFILNSLPHTMEFYQSKSSPQEIISFYKKNLGKEGFILISEDKYNNLLIFSQPSTKDNLLLHIDFIKNELTYFSVSSWKGEPPIKPEDLKKQANGDAPGRDLSAMPRHPDSIRISSMERYGMTNAVYKIPHREEEIISFYENKMPAYGWKRFSQEALVKKKAAQILDKENVFPSDELLLFEKGNSLCGILVIPVSGCQRGCLPGMDKGGSMVSIVSYQIEEKR